MTHLSIRAGAAASYIRERAELAKVPLGNLEITGRTNRIGMVRIASRTAARAGMVDATTRSGASAAIAAGVTASR
jgi:hypothetical protein